MNKIDNHLCSSQMKEEITNKQTYSKPAIEVLHIETEAPLLSLSTKPAAGVSDVNGVDWDY